MTVDQNHSAKHGVEKIKWNAKWNRDQLFKMYFFRIDKKKLNIHDLAPTLENVCSF